MERYFELQIMRGTVYIFFALSLAGCRGWEVPSFEVETEPHNVMIGDLRDYLNAETEMTFAEDIRIAGRVVSSDRAGNFYNTFFIDDGTGAAEVMAGMPDLDAVYHPGQRVSIRAKGLAVGWRDGAMQIGLPPEPGNRFATGYFYHRAVIRGYVAAERDLEPVEPLEVSLAELGGDLCGRLVRIAGLEADTVADAATWASALPAPATGYVKFRSSTADSITVVTSGYASFALAPVPRGRVALTGILFYGRGGASRDHFLLKLRDENDIAY